MSETTRFAIWATDRPGMAAERARVREAHRARLREGGRGGLKVVLGGPTTDEAGAMNGSLLVVEAHDIAAVREFVAGDPYVLGGVYDTVEIRPWRCGLGHIA
jgi:uncharacterized protein YciI